MQGQPKQGRADRMHPSQRFLQREATLIPSTQGAVWMRQGTLLRPSLQTAGLAVCFS